MLSTSQVQQVIDDLNAKGEEKAAKVVQDLHREILQRRLRYLDMQEARDFWRRSFEQQQADHKVTDGV